MASFHECNEACFCPKNRLRTALLPLHCTGSYQQQIGNISFTGEAETEAIKLAAFDILKQLNKEGHISSNELRFIGEKRKIET